MTHCVRKGRNLIKMEYLKDNELLQFHPDTLETIRKLRGYNSRSEINEAIDILDAWVKKQDHYVENNLGDYCSFFIFRFKNMNI